MNKLKWIYDLVNARVVDEDNNLVFYTNDLECKDYVVEEVVILHNNNILNKESEILEELGSEGIIDFYLLDESYCSQEDREIITENIFAYYQLKLKT